MNVDIFKKMGGIKLFNILAVAVFITALNFLAVRLFLPEGNYIRTVFLDRSFIQYMSTFCFWLTMVAVASKHLRCRHELQALNQAREILQDPEFEFTLIWTGADVVRQRFTKPEYGKYQDTLTFGMIINGLDRLRKTQSTSDLHDYFRSQSNINEGELETGYSNTRYLIWLIPTLGFIGTVWGISVGLTEFSEIIHSAEGFSQVKSALPAVTKNLGIAFDTTLLALVLSALAVLYMSWMLKCEEQVLEVIDRLCLDNVCAMFEENDRSSKEIIDFLKDELEALKTAMNGNRVDVENVIQVYLPGLLAEEIGKKMEIVSKGFKSYTESIDALAKQLNALQKTLVDKFSADAQGQKLRSDEIDSQNRELTGLAEDIRNTLNELVNHFKDNKK
jgi:biopolymer transport protein ExbB/TolQ